MPTPTTCAACRDGCSAIQPGRGFSLPELLVALALIGILAATALTLMKFRNSVETVRLRSDVAVANAAVEVYRAGGGSVSGVQTEAAALEKLKTVTTSENGNDREILFLRQSFIDKRLRPVIGQGTPERPAAVWSREQRRFEFTTGGPGIVRFELDEPAGVAHSASERRSMAFQQAKVSGWVWDYSDVASEALRPVPADAESNPLPQPPTSSLPAPPPPARLLPPILDRPPGVYPLKYYPLTVSVYDQNPPSHSILYWRMDGAGWMNGQNIASGTVDPAQAIAAVAVSRDPLAWSDSEPTGGEYSAIQVRPVVRAVFPKSHYNYIEAGGALQSGAYQPAEMAPPGVVRLVNAGDIPGRYQSSSLFRPAWTADGTDPRESPSAWMAADFAHGFPGQPVPLSLGLWGASGSAIVRAGCTIHQPLLFLDGPSQSTVLGIDPLPLAGPKIGPPGPKVSGGGAVTLDLDVDRGDVPVGARVYFTTDGNDPCDADGNGEPDCGTLYDGALKAPMMNGGWTVTARVYPPRDFKPWFRVSEPSVELFQVCTELATQAGATGQGLPIARAGRARRLRGAGPAATGPDGG